MKLSKRLSFLRASADTTAPSIWDIGCDHGFLGLSFIDETRVNTINLVDPSERVIEVLKAKLVDSYITIPEKIKIHHKKGQQITLDSNAKTIFIAGMGGKEIIEIMSTITPQLTSNDLLVISPHRKFLLVREWLKSSELRLKDEKVILEEGTFYPVLTLKKDPSLPEISRYGGHIWSNEEGKAYLQHELRTYARHKDMASQDYLAYLRSLAC